MIKFIIIEDGANSLEVMNRSITKVMMNYNIDYKVEKYKQYNDNLKKTINEDNYTKIYLIDIELPEISGLEIASEIREIDDDSTIIFVTAHPECKDDIFHSRLKAIDFISKYVNYNIRLEETLEYVLKKLYKNKEITFNFGHNYYTLLYKEINYIEKDQSLNKCIIHLINDDVKYVSKTITKLKEELGDPFFRTHKSCLVNTSNIKRIDEANCIIYFKNGDNTDLLAPTLRKELKEYVANH